jgi:hypothetical protein
LGHFFTVSIVARSAIDDKRVEMLWRIDYEAVDV